MQLSIYRNPLLQLMLPALSYSPRFRHQSPGPKFDQSCCVLMPAIPNALAERDCRLSFCFRYGIPGHFPEVFRPGDFKVWDHRVVPYNLIGPCRMFCDQAYLFALMGICVVADMSMDRKDSSEKLSWSASQHSSCPPGPPRLSILYSSGNFVYWMQEIRR